MCIVTIPFTGYHNFWPRDLEVWPTCEKLKLWLLFNDGWNPASVVAFWQLLLTSLLKPLNWIQRNLTGSKISTSSTTFVFFGPIGKTRWPPWPLIGWDIFDFPSETAERNWTKREMNQDLNVLYQSEKRKWPPWPLIGSDIFYFSSKTVERNSTKLDGKQDLNVLYQVCVFRADRKTRWPIWLLIGLDIVDFTTETAEMNSTKPDRNQDFNVFYQVCVFRADRKNKDTLASDWLIDLRLSLWNRWMEFD